MITRIVNVLPSMVLFLRYLVPLARWATNVIKDDSVTLEEVQQGAAEFWPKRDAEGKPLPIDLPWKAK